MVFGLLFILIWLKFSFFFLGFFLGLQMWPDLIQKAKDGGLDVIQTYVFWNGHEPSEGRVMLFSSLSLFLLIFYFMVCIL